MFDFIRKHIKVVMIIFFPLVILAFVITGIDNSFLHKKSPVVAKLQGHEITQEDWENAHRNFVDKSRALNLDMPAEQLDSPSMRYRTLENLIQERLIAQVVKNDRYMISDEQLARDLQNRQELKGIRDENGSINVQKYRELLSTYNISPAQYEAQTRYAIAAEQIFGLPAQSFFATKSLKDLAYQPYFQRREVELAYFHPNDFKSQVETDDANIKTFYEQNKNSFIQPEEIDVEYAVLDLDGYIKKTNISEEDMRQHYEQNKNSYATSQEQRKVRHILIETNSKMSSKDRQAAQKKAEETLQKVRAKPEDFAEIARTVSDDKGTANLGGDLGNIQRGKMVRDFDDAVFKLEKNAISDIVPTEFGLHIIQVLDIQPAKIPSYEEVRERLSQDYKTQLARTEFNEAQDQFLNLSHEQPESLKGISEQLKIDIQTFSGLRQVASEQAPEVLRNQALLTALFTPSSLEEKHNIEPITINGKQVIAARVTAHRPEKIKEFDDAKSDARQLYIDQQAMKLAQETGAKTLKIWQADLSKAKFKQKVTLSRTQRENLNHTDIAKILAVESNKLPQLLGLTQANGSYVIAKINAVAPEYDEGSSQEDRSRIADMQNKTIQDFAREAEIAAYFKNLRRNHKVEIKVENQPLSYTTKE